MMAQASSSAELLKVPWKRAELAVSRFTKTVETDIERIRQLKKNIIEVVNILEYLSMLKSATVGELRYGC